MPFIQLTDLHFVDPGETLFGLSPAARLTEAVAFVNTHHADAEGVLITGDLTHRGSRHAYELLAETLAPLIPPVHLMLGNHDARAPFREVFGGATPFQQFSFTSDGGRVLCLDTLVETPPAPHGELCADRLAWLSDEIAGLPEGMEWILALHHPPLALGLPNMDGSRLRDAEALWEVIAPRPPCLMLIGHVHRPVHGSWRGVPFHIQRGVNHQVAYHPTATPELMFTHEAADLSVVSVTPEGPLIHTRSVGSEGATFPNR